MPYKAPERQKAYQREYQRQKRASQAKPCVKLCTQVDTINAQKIRDLLAEQMENVRSAEGDVFIKARCFAFIASIALKAVEVADLEERVTELENRLKSNQCQ